MAVLASLVIAALFLLLLALSNNLAIRLLGNAGGNACNA